ncbi:SAC3 domain-containing protein 1 isoform X1 [Syngnathus typhle]|uniref:SAC3 domain-containing protein 1 isoform X1 n=1 Tax=Syngnathus typhle TaxID=161592 RepID=UPI002A6A6B87|nr:SAC3 domain-containing protein 1 isoform X1 [Syngnathus typhle]
MNSGGARRNNSSLQNNATGRGEGWRNQGRGRGRCQSHVKDKTVPHGDDTVPRGVCQTMCPAGELRKRESQNRLHRFEMLAGTEKERKPRADPLRAVKEYSRPAAGKDSANSAELRPPAVLLKTVCYLIDEVAASPHLHPWTEVYSFVFDRLRSVKQDMIIQRAHGPDCVAVLERMVRFLLYASYRLCDEPLRHFDPRINDTHLQENLRWLLDCYTHETGPHPNQEEFQALGLLYNLGSSVAMRHIMELPAPLRHTPAIMLAISINQAFLERNTVRLLRSARRLNFLQACAMHRHVTASRKDLLLLYSHGFSSRNCRFPLSVLSKLLGLEKSLTSTLCRACGVEVNADEQVVFSKTSFAEPEQGERCCSLYHNIVTEKQKDLTIGNIIHGTLTKDTS